MSVAEFAEIVGWWLLAWATGFGAGTLIRQMRQFSEHV